MDFLSGVKLKAQQGTALPMPGAAWHTMIFVLLGGPGKPDHLYVCLKKADGTYWWCNATGLNERRI